MSTVDVYDRARQRVQGDIIYIQERVPEGVHIYVPESSSFAFHATWRTTTSKVRNTRKINWKIYLQAELDDQLPRIRAILDDWIQELKEQIRNG